MTDERHAVNGSGTGPVPVSSTPIRTGTSERTDEELLAHLDRYVERINRRPTRDEVVAEARTGPVRAGRLLKVLDERHGWESTGTKRGARTATKGRSRTGPKVAAGARRVPVQQPARTGTRTDTATARSADTTGTAIDTRTAPQGAAVPGTETDTAASGRTLKGWLRQVDLRLSPTVLVTAAPLVGLNGIALYGQYQAVLAEVPGINKAGAIGIGLVLETIALFLAHHAHQALLSGDSALRLRLTSYLFGGLVGTLNYWHQAPDWKPNALALVYGAASVLSPWLWAIHSRRTNRDRLLNMGLIERRAAKFSAARWLMYPIRTLRMVRWAIWSGEQDPSKAVSWWNEDNRNARV